MTEPAAAQSHQRSLLGWLGTAPGALKATATLVTAVLGVVFLLVPEWRPLPRDEIRASITVDAIESDVSVVDWARRQYPGHPDRALRELIGKGGDRGFRGLVVYVNLQADGFKRRAIRLRTRVYDATTKRPDENLDPAGMAYPKAGRLEIDAPSRASVQLLLLDDFSDLGGRYFVRVEAYDEDGILAFADSKQIPQS